jgi:acetyl-CoA carboxylase biotin carboxyl carrier protein
MAEQESDPSEPLDVKRIHQLVRLMKRYDLTDVYLTDGNVKIRLKRRGPEAASPPLNMTGAQLVVPVGQQAYREAPPPAASPVSGPGPAAPEASSTSKTIVIESPMVGTYYASTAPDSPPFVSVGSVVQPDSTLCIIEAMKVFTDIPAGVSGTIAEILVKNGQPVEFGQPLFRVVPA